MKKLDTYYSTVTELEYKIELTNLKDNQAQTNELGTGKISHREKHRSYNHF
jgi:hypothetical protein